MNEKIYIGYTKNFSERWCNHKAELRKSVHSNEYLQRAWNKYGKKQFKFERIDICYTHELIEREHYWCMLLKSHDPKIGYNQRETGKNAPGRKPGFKLSEETKKKISESRKGKCVGADNYWYGKKFSKERKVEMSRKGKGRPNLKLRGKKSTDEHRKSLSIAHMGHKLKEESKAKLSIAMKNDPGRKERMSALGKSFSKSVIKMDSDGKNVVEYKSATEAARDMECNVSIIIKCCTERDRHKKCKGFYWIYKDMYYEYSQEKGKRSYKGVYIPEVI